MSSINFNDYANYANYDTGYDFSALMGGTTKSSGNLLSKVGITIGKGNQLELDEDALKEASIATLKSLFTGSGSFADKISQKAGSLSIVAANAAAKVKGTTYTSSGSYSDTFSKLVSSTLDEKVGDKDKRSNSQRCKVYERGS